MLKTIMCVAPVNGKRKIRIPTTLKLGAGGGRTKTGKAIILYFRMPCTVPRIWSSLKTTRGIFPHPRIKVRAIVKDLPRLWCVQSLVLGPYWHKLQRDSPAKHTTILHTKGHQPTCLSKEPQHRPPVRFARRPSAGVPEAYQRHTSGIPEVYQRHTRGKPSGKPKYNGKLNKKRTRTMK